MKREIAIKQLSEADLARLTLVERNDQLRSMQSEDWAGVPGWHEIDPEVRALFEDESAPEITSPGDRRYDPLLLLWLQDGLRAASNEYLSLRISQLGVEQHVQGTPVALHPCPCCGHRTIDAPADYDICAVCWWEDDGTDDPNVDIVSGPNRISLRDARVNFIVHGIYDPCRADLMKLREPPEKYVLGRRFVLTPSGSAVVEVATSDSS